MTHVPDRTKYFRCRSKAMTEEMDNESVNRLIPAYATQVSKNQPRFDRAYLGQ